MSDSMPPTVRVLGPSIGQQLANAVEQLKTAERVAKEAQRQVDRLYDEYLASLPE